MNWLEALRDRIVVRSQVGKRKLDAVWTRRALDHKLSELGGCFLSMVQAGRITVPEEIAGLVKEARDLEEILESQYSDIASLKSEVAG